MPARELALGCVTRPRLTEETWTVSRQLRTGEGHFDFRVAVLLWRGLLSHYKKECPLDRQRWVQNRLVARSKAFVFEQK